MAKTIKKHWDIAAVIGIGLFLTIAGIVGMFGMISLPSSVSAATTATVDVQATVSETIEISVSSSVMNLGTLSSGSVSATSNDFTIKTNAGSGYTVNLKDKNYTPTSSAPGLHKISSPTSTIASASTTLLIGTEGYGAQGTTTDGDVNIDAAYGKSGNSVGGLEITDQAFCTAGSATAGDQTTLTLKTTISATTTAGSYEDQLTLTAVGSF